MSAMARWLRPVLFALVLYGAVPQGTNPALAQTPQLTVQIPAEGVVQEVMLRDGSTLFGRVIETGEPFRFQTLSGQVLELRRADVSRIRSARGRIVDGRFWREDPNSTRLFFGPTARTLPAGDGYLSVFQIIFPIVAVGATDWLTLAAGTPLIFSSSGGFPFWLAPKAGVQVAENLHVAGGVLAFFLPRDDDSAGLLYGVATHGHPDASVHVGVGYGYVNGELASRPAILLGGEYRVGANLKLLTENYLFPEDGGLLGGGVRFFGERLSADLGLATPVGWNGDWFVFPLVNFSWSW